MVTQLTAAGYFCTAEVGLGVLACCPVEGLKNTKVATLLLSKKCLAACVVGSVYRAATAPVFLYVLSGSARSEDHISLLAKTRARSCLYQG